ncbi:Cytokinin glycosidase [Parasponia andersonii]|uniref:Cytokinin glycosidase n=1 Tax=Parasponia andersonii TaxID=3476 RepID=A0A2P5AE42_PARAD|nr:Cytokinin glycosidase [Parasponia andersonii]
MNVSLGTMMEVQNSCSGGWYQERSDIECFIAIIPNEDFSYECFGVATCDDKEELCELFCKETKVLIPYDILAIGKVLFG